VDACIAPVEDTINGTIVIDGAVSPGGLVSTPITCRLEKGVITAIEGGPEASKMLRWMEARHDETNDETIYHNVHFSFGLNPKAGISTHMIECERLLGSVDFGFGSQYHTDVVVVSPTIYLDGKVMCERNKLSQELGFVEM
jgi:leucyl aminopeptidase (aminopeptidase T)